MKIAQLAGQGTLPVPSVKMFSGSWEIETRLTYNCAHLRSTKESLTFFILTLGGTVWYLVVLGQYRTVGVDK